MIQARPRGSTQTQAQLKALIAGMPKVPPTVTSITVLNTVYTIPALGAALAGYEAPYDAADAAEVQYANTIDTLVAAAPAAVSFAAATRAALKAALGRQAPGLSLVGVAPDKTPAPLDNVQTAKKIAQNKATRAARHTVGPKVKKALKGVIPSAATPPDAAPAPATPAAAPTPAAK